GWLCFVMVTDCSSVCVCVCVPFSPSERTLQQQQHRGADPRSAGYCYTNGPKGCRARGERTCQTGKRLGSQRRSSTFAPPLALSVDRCACLSLSLSLSLSLCDCCESTFQGGAVARGEEGR